MSNLTNVFALFQAAVSNGLKYPKITLQAPNGQPVVISRNGSLSRTPGHLSVTNGGRYGTPQNIYYGRVTPSGEFFQANVYNRTSYDVRPLLNELAGDPVGVAQRYGKLTGRCMFCELALTDPQSVAHGYGPVCAKHYNLPWSKGDMKASREDETADAVQHLVDSRSIPEHVISVSEVPALTADEFDNVIDVQATVVETNEVPGPSPDQLRLEALDQAITILKASEYWKNCLKQAPSIEDMRKALQAHMKQTFGR